MYTRIYSKQGYNGDFINSKWMALQQQPKWAKMRTQKKTCWSFLHNAFSSLSLSLPFHTQIPSLALFSLPLATFISKCVFMNILVLKMKEKQHSMLDKKNRKAYLSTFHFKIHHMLSLKLLSQFLPPFLISCRLVHCSLMHD